MSAHPWDIKPGDENLDPFAAPSWEELNSEHLRPEADLSEDFGGDVARELHRLKVRDRAQDMHRGAKAGPIPEFDAGTLAEVLSRPAEPPQRVDGLIPSEGGTLIVAQRKTGKTTLMLNLARALLTGEDFLGRFGVRALEGRVAFLNYEVSGAQLARWAYDVNLPGDDLYLVNVRGRRNPLAITDDRGRLAEQLRAQNVETLIIDPFGRAYSGKSQNDPGEVGAWLADLDRWARGEVGASDVILAAHAGWDAERTRGASALEDWADSVITLVRDKDDETIRYLRAFGRDVEVEEDRLTYDPATRALGLSGGGSRRAHSLQKRVEDLVPAVVEVVTASPGLSMRAIGKALTETGRPHRNGEEAAAARIAVTAGRLRTEQGPRNALLHFPSDCSPPLPTAPGGHLLTAPTAPIRVGAVSGAVDTTTAPRQATFYDAFDSTPDKACRDCEKPIPSHHAMCADCAQMAMHSPQQTHGYAPTPGRAPLNGELR